MASATGIFTGFQVTCPYCHDHDAIVSLDLNNLDLCSCDQCNESFSPVTARDLAAAELARWEAVVRWIALAAPATGD